jgi:hypothetical protein
MNIGNLLKEQSEYIAALYSIVFVLKKREFERSDDPLGAAIATADEMRQKLLNAGSGEDAMSRLVVEFFDEIVADLQSRTNGRPHNGYGPSITRGSA